MTATELRAKVVEVIVAELKVDVDHVRDTALFEKDLKADSLDMVELIIAFEDQFDIEISEEDAEKMRTVGQAIDLVTQKLATQ